MKRGVFGGIAAAAMMAVGALAYLPRSQRFGGGKPKGYRIVRRLNRSQHWRRASSYAHARALSPFPDLPVR
jgi:hypothetical protein